MKKCISLLLTAALILSLSLCPASAVTIEEMDRDETLSAVFDFEPGCGYVHSANQSSFEYGHAKTVSYYTGGWGFEASRNNPVMHATGEPESVLNDSTKVLAAEKNSYNTWGTGGGSVMNRTTDNGVEPLILESNTTYRVEFDYLVLSTHYRGTVTDPASGQQYEFKDTLEDVMSFGYGYRETNSNELCKLNQPVTTVEKFVSYRPNTNSNGTYTGDHGKQRKTGSWYHASYTFTTGQFGDVDSVTNAPFLVFYTNKFTGFRGYLDNIRVQKQITVTLYDGSGTYTGPETLTGFGGEAMNLQNPSRFGWDFTGWYRDGRCTVPADTRTFAAWQDGAKLYAGYSHDRFGFEGYTSATADGKTVKDCFTVSDEHAFSGDKSMKYTYTAGRDGRTDESNVFSLRQAENGKKYAISFWYRVEKGSGFVAYPATFGNTVNTALRGYSESGITAVGNGRWQKATVYATTDLSAGGTYLGLHIHAANDEETVVYLDDIQVRECDNYSSFTLEMKQGSVFGSTTATVFAAVGDSTADLPVENGGRDIEGIYEDAACTVRVPDSQIHESWFGKTRYVRFTDTAGFENYAFSGNARLCPAGVSVTSARAKSGNASLRFDLAGEESASHTAAILQTDAQRVLVRFSYLTDGLTAPASLTVARTGSDKTDSLTPGPDTITLYPQEDGSWKTAELYLEIPQNSAENWVCLSVEGASAGRVYIDDVSLKACSAQPYRLTLDATAYGYRLHIVYALPGETLVLPENPEKIGFTFVGWYTDPECVNLFQATTLNADLTVYAGMEAVAISPGGDANGDGSADSADLARLKKYLAGYPVLLNDQADVNGDGRVDAVDLVLLYRRLSGRVG